MGDNLDTVVTSPIPFLYRLSYTGLLGTWSLYQGTWGGNPGQCTDPLQGRIMYTLLREFIDDNQPTPHVFKLEHANSTHTGKWQESNPEIARQTC